MEGRQMHSARQPAGRWLNSAPVGSVAISLQVSDPSVRMVAQFRSQEEISDMDTTGETGQTGQPRPSAPAGWYPDPEMADTDRYFDGESWTDDVAPATPPPSTQRSIFGPILGALIAFAVILFIVISVVNQQNRDDKFHDDYCQRVGC